MNLRARMGAADDLRGVIIVRVPSPGIMKRCRKRGATYFAGSAESLMSAGVRRLAVAEQRA